VPNPEAEDSYARMIRAVLMAILVIGIVGTGVELLLLKHTDGWKQYIPLVLMAASLVVIVAAVAWPNPLTIRALQLTMLIFLVSGVVGVLWHYQGNAEWELERMASLSGIDLFKAAMMGATPALAPGTMAQLGLVGLLYTYKHPAAHRKEQS
jgi:hypothetical protein